MMIGGLAEAGGVGVETIRYYQRRGLLETPHSAGAMRRYGEADARRLRFIGDARQRIREDHLRILRYFRFQARFGSQPADAAAELADPENILLHRANVRRLDPVNPKLNALSTLYEELLRKYNIRPGRRPPPQRKRRI